MLGAILWVIFYGIIEGITEWLPVSSTGHLIIFENLFTPNATIFTGEFMEFFRVAIQLGAILAVVVSYFKRLNPFSRKLTIRGRKRVFDNWKRIIVGCIPAGVFGLLLNDWFDEHFYTWEVVAATLIIYGIIFIIIEFRNKYRKPKYETMEELPYRTVLFIGLFQVLSLVPGTSRSGVTILAALLLGASRLAAADFTFCMAIPIMAGASGLKALKYIVNGGRFSFEQIIIIVIGLVAAYVVSSLAVKFLLKFIKKNDFKVFGYYRIVLGVLIVALALIFPSIFKTTSQYGLPSYVDEQYIQKNENSRPGIELEKVNDIVIHYTANPGSSAQNNRDYFNNLAKEPVNQENSRSSNFVVGLDGEIIAVVPITEIAYCSNSRNNDTISIEVCHADETGEFNEKTYDSLVKITAWLCNHYNLDSSHVIRHYDITGKICPKYFVDYEDAWEIFKIDVQTQIDELAKEAE